MRYFDRTQEAVRLQVKPHMRVTSSAKLFNFMNAALPPGATLTRASSGTRFNSAGVLVLETTDVARWTYNPATLANEGLLVEPARTNLHLNSAAMDNASWTKTRAAATADVGVSPDGTTTADRLTEDSTATNSHNLTRVETVVGSTVYANSVFAKPGSGGLRHWLQLGLFDGVSEKEAFFDITNGVVGVHSLAFASSIKAISNGWFRPEAGLLTTASPGTTNVDRSLASADNTAIYSGNGSAFIDFWGMQFEAAPDGRASSYIPTSGASATRAADVLALTIPTGTYSIDITRLSGVAHLTGVSVSGNSYTVPTDTSPLQRISARRTG
jgi:hypothetical protein